MLKTHGRSEPFQVRGEIATHGNTKPCKASVDAPIRPMFALRPTATGRPTVATPGSTALFNLVFGAAKFTAATAAAHRTTWKQLRAKILTRPPSSPVDSKKRNNQSTFNWDSFKSIIRSRVPVRPRRPRSAWRGWKMACLWRSRSASSRAQSASPSVERRWQQGLVIGVTDLVQRGEDMKSGLARPLENYFCLGLNFQNTRSTSKNVQARQAKCSNHSGA